MPRKVHIRGEKADPHGWSRGTKPRGKHQKKAIRQPPGPTWQDIRDSVELDRRRAEHAEAALGRRDKQTAVQGILRRDGDITPDQMYEIRAGCRFGKSIAAQIAGRC